MVWACTAAVNVQTVRLMAVAKRIAGLPHNSCLRLGSRKSRTPPASGQLLIGMAMPLACNEVPTVKQLNGVMSDRRRIDHPPAERRQHINSRIANIGKSQPLKDQKQWPGKLVDLAAAPVGGKSRRRNNVGSYRWYKRSGERVDFMPPFDSLLPSAIAMQHCRVSATYHNHLIDDLCPALPLEIWHNALVHLPIRLASSRPIGCR